MAETETKEKEEPKKSVRPKMIPVKVIQSRGKSVLVEYMHSEKLYRCYVPTVDLIGDRVALDKLQAGISYGLNWSEIGTLSIDPDALDFELKRNGIYTLSDLQASPQLVNLTLARLAGVTKVRLVTFAKEKEA